jgi:hypothetical protein
MGVRGIPVDGVRGRSVRGAAAGALRPPDDGAAGAALSDPFEPDDDFCEKAGTTARRSRTRTETMERMLERLMTRSTFSSWGD